ncbi:hypothetical protein Dda_2572 [Drechslerella dactyloides]|uniref:Uncharacterized protein n=1 Tax=Drechslerella dactyloides TaxID=74499 RepID=A0AAD6NM35_DREDA|nr:hypothetical protein Dda_2572 [Drechslerella dactyloides]
MAQNSEKTPLLAPSRSQEQICSLQNTPDRLQPQQNITVRFLYETSRPPFWQFFGPKDSQWEDEEFRRWYDAECLEPFDPISMPVPRDIGDISDREYIEDIRCRYPGMTTRHHEEARIVSLYQEEGSTTESTYSCSPRRIRKNGLNIHQRALRGELKELRFYFRVSRPTQLGISRALIFVFVAIGELIYEALGGKHKSGSS